jgi:glycosyltransferase involved in cell wall biosynthesis
MAGDGPLRDELCSVTASNVRWVGFVNGEEKNRLITGCRALVFPSLWPEPLSTVAYEAYERAKPVLSSDAGGMKEIVLEGETGRVLKAACSPSWCAAILQLGEDSRLARFWGMNGRRWLEKNSSPDDWNRQFNRIVEQALRPADGM